MDRITTVSDGETVLTREYTFTATQIATNHIQATVGTGTGATGYDDPDPYTYGVTYSYTYDDNGNILSISDGTYTTSYAYDSANQLIRENNQQLGFTRTWAYDNAGNILCRREYAYTTGSLENLVPVEVHEMSGYGMYGIGDLFAEYDGQVMSYDAIGNPLYDGQWTYTWEHGRELASMSDGYSTWEYTYDANGMRTQRTDGYYTYSYIYNGSQLSQLTVVYDDGEHYEYHRLNFAYSADGTPLTVTYGGCTYYYVTNIQGDVIAILDDIGRLVCRYAYDAWGNVTICDERPDNVSWYNPLRYRGYVYDWETELYYLQSRYYSPKIGRFLNADSVVSGAGGDVLGNNMFSYCFNNPINHSDSSGNWPKWIKKRIATVSARAVAVAVVVSTVVNHIVNAVNTKKIDKEIKETYDVNTATQEINAILESYGDDVYATFNEDGVEINNSVAVNSRYDRQKISTIISRTDELTKREADNLSAEWFFHNAAYAFHIKRESAVSAFLDYSKDDRWYVVGATKLLEIFGWE